MENESKHIVWESNYLDKNDFDRLLGQKGCVLWFTGLSGSGKSTLAKAVQKALFSRTKYAVVLDGDNVRHGLNQNLSFSEEDRKENIRRVSEVCKLFVHHGAIIVTAFISPFRADRIAAREVIGDENFIEIHVATPLEVCIERDVKGLYKKALAGEIKNFTGISQAYEIPAAPKIEVRTDLHSLELCVGQIVDYLTNEGYI
ncbi:adenylyl-sulfate kinase [Marinilongibacter aquaticus]|uniref:adenylyl-sulfate kinase n=1 Tax=Marinilongibacter aquaticus TaxID=2975157 RepID=UPI0021BD13F8|nr:adenylyl-sulfate kinase [Marinilongibacter aquaticus]UBM58088.1 adenylyl-sulfate kinase [Marinilongibacter aquaticus]